MVYHGLSLETRVFRASPRFKLVLFDRLSREEREQLADLRRNPSLYGVIRERGKSVSRAIAASRDAALLFLTLQEPGPLPSYVAATADTETERSIAELVLDGVLEIEVDGTFVSGAGALGDTGAGSEARGRLALLSRAAMMYAASLQTDDEQELAAALYCYNRSPLTPDWSRRIRGTAALRAFAGADHGATAAELNRHWTSETDSDADGWIHWMRKGEAEFGARSAATYKLYVSPTLECLPQAFAASVRVFAEARVANFKLGRAVPQLVRPDKFVAYFSSRDRAVECGERLVEEMSGMDAHGVPFTAEIGGDGLVSLGADPPSAGALPQDSSWRFWVCRRLGRYLSAAVRESPAHAVPPWRFALERLRLDGVDTDAWTPDVGRLAPTPRSIA